MGGVGSGNHYRWGAKDTTEAYRALDVRRWAREGYLNPGYRFGWQWSRDGDQVASIQVETHSRRLVLIYRSRSYGEDWTDHRYSVHLDATPCHLGGERVWFLCPARGCGRRVAKLYGGEIFACRQCHRLAYPSQNEDAANRSARRAQKLRDRLGWPGGVFDGSDLGRPKGMHRKTYRRLVAEHDFHADQSNAAMMEHLVRLQSILGR